MQGGNGSLKKQNDNKDEKRRAPNNHSGGQGRPLWIRSVKGDDFLSSHTKKHKYNQSSVHPQAIDSRLLPLPEKPPRRDNEIIEISLLEISLKKIRRKNTHHYILIFCLLLKKEQFWNIEASWEVRSERSRIVNSETFFVVCVTAGRRNPLGSLPPERSTVGSSLCPKSREKTIKKSMHEINNNNLLYEIKEKQTS